MERSKRSKSMDRLSSLPEDIIFRILTHIDDTKEAVRTSVLSKQWRYHWTHLPSLNFNFPCFNNWPLSLNVLTNVLQQRQPTKLFKLKINFVGLDRFLDKEDEWRQKIVLLALDYAASHQIEEFETDFRSRYFDLQNLESLKLDGGLGFRCLKTLKLKGEYYTHMVTEHIISRCEYLENLVLIGCSHDSSYHISHPRLVSLHLTDHYLCRQNSIITVTAPNLKFFDVYLSFPIILNLKGCSNIEKVNIYMSVRSPYRKDPTPDLAWARPVNEFLFYNKYRICEGVLRKEDHPPFDARAICNDTTFGEFIRRLTIMCKLCRDEVSGTKVLHVFGKEIILNPLREGAQPESESELESSYAYPFGEIVNKIFTTIRNGKILDYPDASGIVKKYPKILSDMMWFDIFDGNLGDIEDI